MIRPIKKTFKKNNTYYQQIYRKGDYCIYSLRYSPETAIIGFDVIKIHLSKPCTFRGPDKPKEKDIPFEMVEGYPSNGFWGTSAWSYTTLTAAKSHFDKLTGGK